MWRFTLFGFPVEVRWQFWLVTALLGGGLSARGATEMRVVLLWIAVVFVSILIHELGHALTMRHLGDPRVRIVLHSFGGFAQGSRWTGRTEDIAISAAGPAASMLIGTIGWAVQTLMHPDRGYFALGLHFWLQVNLFWALVNLLPIFPLDGGHISMALFGPDRQRQAFRLSIAAAVVVAALSFVGGDLYLMMFFGLLAWNNWQRMNLRSEVQWMR